MKLEVLHSQHFAWRTEIDVSVIGEEPVPRFPKRVEIALFRITQEALTNVAKHSYDERGWGLLTINQRAEAIGGLSRIESTADKGTQVIIEVDR